MRIPKSLLVFASAIFIAVFVLGVFAWYTVSKYSLPFAALPIIATFLGPTDLFATYSSAAALVPSSTSRKASKRPLPPFPLAINLALLILPTVLIALGAPNLSGESKCQLKNTWQGWFSTHNRDAIKGVQDALKCCGFGQVKEMPFPFPKGPKKKGEPDEVPANTCAVALGHNTPCALAWEGELKLASGLVVAAAALTLVAKFAFLMIVLTRPKFAEGWFARQEYSKYDNTRTIEHLGDDYEQPEDDEAPPTRRTTSDVPAIGNGVNERTGLLLARDHGGRSSHPTAIHGEDVWDSP